MSNTLHFEKWEATGNDFIFVDAKHYSLDETSLPAAAVKKACCRQSGIGADGVVLYYRSTSNEAVKMVVINSDGSQGQMCGNALRCLAELLWRADGEPEHTVELAGRQVTVISGEPGRATVKMGTPQKQGDNPLFSSLDDLDRQIGERGYLLSFGNPHYVVPVDTLADDWKTRGADCQAVSDRLLGTGGINCGFLVSTLDENECYTLRVYERGAGATLSCGSGACAASAVLEHQLSRVPPHRLALPGGVLTIGRDKEILTLTGSVNKEFEGEWHIEL